MPAVSSSYPWRSDVLARQRQGLIVAEVRRRGGAKISDLTTLLGVSHMTVRRDLDVLARRGLIDKVHGGALQNGRSVDEPGFEVKSARERREKESIAAAAAVFVRPGSAIALSAGTTTYVLSRHLLDVAGLTVVTNSTRVASAFESDAEVRQNGQTIILTGGVRTPSDALVGPVAETTIRSLHFDLLFLGCHGLDARAGLTTPNLAEAETNRLLVRSARRVIVVADSTKWGVVALSTFAALDSIDVLVTDDGLDVAAQATLGEQVGQLVLAELGPDPARPREGRS